MKNAFELAEEHGISKVVAQVTCPMCHFPRVGIVSRLLIVENEKNLRRNLHFQYLCAVCGYYGDLKTDVAMGLFKFDEQVMEQEIVKCLLHGVHERGSFNCLPNKIIRLRQKAIEVNKEFER